MQYKDIYIYIESELLFCTTTGGNIYTLSKILGHSSVKVTEQAYLDLNDADIRKNYQQFSPLNNLKR